MPQGSSPMWFGAVSDGVAGYLQGSTACFRIIAGLVSYRPELQLRKPDTLRGCRFGGLGLRWVVLSNALTATANPSPPSLQPR